MHSTLSWKATPKTPAPGVELVDGEFTPEYRQFRETVRRFIAKEIDPYYQECEKTAESCPEELWKKGAEAGFRGLCVPEEFGGPGGDLLYTLIMSEESGAAVAGCSVGSLYTNDLLTAILLEYAAKEQKRQYFPGILHGDGRQALGLTEPDAGCDINAMPNFAAVYVGAPGNDLRRHQRNPEGDHREVPVGRARGAARCRFMVSCGTLFQQ